MKLSETPPVGNNPEQVREFANQKKRLLTIATDIRAWLNGIVSCLEKDEITTNDFDYVERELRNIEQKLEKVTSTAVLDR